MASQYMLAQGTSEARLATDVQSAVESVTSQPTLSAWRGSHSRERVDPAHYETTKDSYEVDFPNQWCVTSIAELPPGVTRAASFYVPEVTAGKLPPLPDKPGSALAGSCRLGAVWLEAQGQSSAAGIINALTPAWGVPAKPARMETARNLHIRGSGLWKDVSSWRRGRVTIWVGWTNWDKGNGVGPRTLIWIVRDRPRDVDLFTAGFDTTAAALKIAGLGPVLTADMKPGANCAALGAESTVGRLCRWLKASNSLPADRRAAALLVADSFVGCAQAGGAKPGSLSALGVKFEAGCPQDGPNYAGNFRQQAERLDPHGPAGALASLASLQSPCSLKGSGSWPNHVLDKGQQVLRQFPPGPWSPWMHFAIARAHDVKLSFSVPPGEADIEVVHRLSAAQAGYERSAAIAEFARFIDHLPGSPQAVFAWQEAWRLMAGLLPSPTHFGCGCE